MLDALQQHMEDFGDTAGQEQICVTSSSQQGLDLVSLLFLDEGTPIVLEMPSYLGALQAFRRCGVEMHGVPMDEDGMKMDELEKVLDKLEKEGQKPPFIYTIPDFQNPSGITMSLERRKELIRIATERQILILEDSPYREIRFSGDTIPSIWSLSGGKGVLMLKTFSKVLFPGMRLGWMVGETDLIEKIVLLKQSVDLCSPSFNQLILASFIRKGMMKTTIDKAIECYSNKAGIMLKALEEHMPKEVTWSKPVGGMFLWVVLPERIDTKEIFMTAIKNNVAYVIGGAFHCDGSGGHTLRLNYSFPSPEQIDKGIKQLADTIREVL